jgi:hypothetical protein
MENLKPQELRIGNLLYFPFTDENVEVLGINAHENSEGIYNTISFKKNSNLYCEPILVLEPIKLTEEWLEKFGYFDTETPNNFTKNPFTIDEQTFWNCKGMFIDDKNGVYVKYVHQLQNLHFCLYGKELVAKELIPKQEE